MLIEYTIGLYSKNYKKEDITSVEKLLDDKKLREKGIYEILDKKEFIKPYFDIDLKRIEHEDQFDYYINNIDNFLDKVTQIIGKYFEFDKEDLAISTATTDKKISYHIIINNYKITFKNFIQFMKNDDINKDFKENYIDTSVYNDKQKMRIIHTKKSEEK